MLSGALAPEVPIIRKEGCPLHFIQYKGSAQSTKIGSSETNIQNIHAQLICLSETFIQRIKHSQKPSGVIKFH